MLAELRTLRKEHTEASKDTKESLTRVETAFSEVAERTTPLEQQMTDYEDRLVDVEEKTQRNDRALRYLLHREANMTAKCKDLESRARRNNLRIYGVKEDEENNSNMLEFTSDLIRIICIVWGLEPKHSESTPLANHEAERPEEATAVHYRPISGLQGQGDGNPSVETSWSSDT